MMKNLALLVIISGCLIFFACQKNTKSEKFLLLTGPTWTSETLLADGVDASGPGGLLAKFKGDAKFRVDGTGYFGQYIGTWRFAYNETELFIDSDSLQTALTANIAELTRTSLKITTAYPRQPIPLEIEMTFKTK
jgi:hypothetical protein